MQQRQSDIHELSVLLRSYHPLVIIDTVEEARATDLVSKAARKIPLSVRKWSVVRGLQQEAPRSSLTARFKESRKTEPSSDLAEPVELLQHLATSTKSSIYILYDFAPYLNDPALNRLFRELLQTFNATPSVIVLIGPGMDIPPGIRHKGVVFPMNLPTKEDLSELLAETVDHHIASRRIAVQIGQEERAQLVNALLGLTLNQARQVIHYCIFEDGKLTAADIQLALNRKVQLIKDDGLLEYMPQQDNTAELGGFQNLKSFLLKIRPGFDPQIAKKYNLPFPKGLLLLGVQGCGKSLAAKFAAKALQFPLVKLDTGRLYDKFIGETEKNLRKVISMAETLAPVVLWIDEIEKALQGSSGDTEAGVNQRIFATLLNWLQEKKAPVFVVATANRIEVLPPELQRKGRFDEIFFVDLPNEAERAEIYSIHLKLRNFPITPEQAKSLANMTNGFTGAEIEQTVVAGLYEALARDPNPTVHFGKTLIEEIQNTVPLSVSRKEEVELLRQRLKERYIPVSGPVGSASSA